MFDTHPPTSHLTLLRPGPSCRRHSRRAFSRGGEQSCCRRRLAGEPTLPGPRFSFAMLLSSRDAAASMSASPRAIVGFSSAPRHLQPRQGQRQTWMTRRRRLPHSLARCGVNRARPDTAVPEPARLLTATRPAFTSTACSVACACADLCRGKMDGRRGPCALHTPC